MTKKANAGPPAKSYIPSDEEVAAIRTLRKKSKERSRSPNLKLDCDSNGQSVTATFDHPDAFTAQCLAMLDMGTDDTRFFHTLTQQIVALGEPGKFVSEHASNFALSVIRAVEPKDELEAMLAAQMAVVHQAMMMMARRLNHVETLPQQDSAERALNKLARTFATQIETLKRYRSKGQQVVRVERVTVGEGGQAIVGHVETGGRAKAENGR